MPAQIIVAIIVLWFSLQNHVKAQTDELALNFRIETEEKEYYQIGDMVQCTLIASQGQRTCAKGVNKIRLYAKGLKINSQHPWIEFKTGEWHKSFQVMVTGNKSEKLQITAYRKTDKGTFVETINFKLSNSDI